MTPRLKRTFARWDIVETVRVCKKVHPDDGRDKQNAHQMDNVINSYLKYEFQAGLTSEE